MPESWIASENGRYKAQVCFYDEQGGFVRVSPPFHDASPYFLNMHAITLFIRKCGELEEPNPHVYVTTQSATVLHVVDPGINRRDFKTQVRKFAQDLVDTLDGIDDFGNPNWISLAKEGVVCDPPSLYILEY